MNMRNYVIKVFFDEERSTFFFCPFETIYDKSEIMKKKFNEYRSG